VIPAVATIVLTAGLVAEAAGGQILAGSPDRVFSSVSIDSRTIAPGSLFIALAGPHFDGHAFVTQAIGGGATGVLVSRVPDAGTAAVIVVDDTLLALQRLARVVRDRSKVNVVAITGSAGKTSTKELTAEFLAVRYRVFRNAGNLNNHIGLPLSLLELRHGPDVAVVELGMNHPGEIRTLIEIAQPDVRVWTNVGDAHIGHFGSRQAIADAKAEILEAASPQTRLIVNADDPLITARIGTFPGRTITFGESADADVRATRVVDRGFDGTAADVVTPSGSVHLAVGLPGRAQLSNALAATATALEFGVALSAIAERAAAIPAVRRRGSITRLPNGARVIDDSYNASPAAVAAMLSALRNTATAGRRIAVLGEMLELGDSAADLHRACGRAAAENGVDELVVIGGADADALAEGAAAHGLSSARIHRFATSEAAAPAVQQMARRGDLVLIKGSRGTRTDIVADRLKEGA
jgi:UDP-N-acetylmuramoyl-tripeptide--D-alanyl-D-alanine ligase